MIIRPGITLSRLLLVGALVFAQSPCSECLRSAENEMKACLNSAISVDDKTACEDRRDEQLKACSDGECRVEREKREQRTDVPPPAP